MDEIHMHGKESRESRGNAKGREEGQIEEARGRDDDKKRGIRYDGCVSPKGWYHGAPPSFNFKVYP